MAVRKTVEDTFVVAGKREQWFSRCKDALSKGGFTAIQANEAFGQVKGDYKTFSVWGSIEITLMPEGENTKIVAKAMANVDNIFALFSSPGKKIIEAFKSNVS
ncbi:MAG: hypothetical protein JNM18_15775 [Planctomycetaceae bacterium]|nr:hypothetical protein [Planctomycetaceae bacterium]